MTRWLHRILLILCCTAGTAAAQTPSLADGDTFPDFSLARSDASTWHMKDHAGQPKLVMFWATWCPFCRKLFPGIVALHDQYASQGLEIVAVNFRDDGDTDAYARKRGLEFDIVLKGDALAAEVGAHGTPTVFVLDSRNRVVLRTTTSNPNDAMLLDAVAATMSTVVHDAGAGR